MDKIASLPVMPAQRPGGPSARQPGSTDFLAQLGVMPFTQQMATGNTDPNPPQGGEPSVQVPEQLVSPQERPAPPRAADPRMTPEGVTQVDMLSAELHRFSVFASNKLSYLPRVFGVASDGAAALTGSSPLTPARAAIGRIDAAAHSTVGAAPADDASIGLLSAQQSTDGEAREYASVTEASAPTVPAVWMPRRLRLRETEAGMEVVVRDYHIRESDQDALLTALREQLHQQGVQPYRIWLNGHVVWQARPSAN